MDSSSLCTSAQSGQDCAEPVVYVIDDEESMRFALRNLFRSVALRVETFEPSLDFLDFPKYDSPSCLILDVRLRGENGLSFQEHVAKSGLCMPVVFMTGHGDIPMTVQAMKAGAVDFFSKPFRDQDMLDAVVDASKTRSRASYRRTIGCGAPPRLRLPHAARARDNGVRRSRADEQADCLQGESVRNHSEVASISPDAKDGGTNTGGSRPQIGVARCQSPALGTVPGWRIRQPGPRFEAMRRSGMLADARWAGLASPIQLRLRRKALLPRHREDGSDTVMSR